ncbi:MAG: hypothetical protein R3263_09505 [Myxococcota bacterium]|nr:hypothetical protein [Myxococcota bacterium]
MHRILPTLLLPALMLLAAAHAGAEAAQPPTDEATLVRLGPGEVDDAEVRTDGRVRFRNEVEAPTRLVFERGAAEALACRTDGRRVIRSRPGQYVIAAGAELACTVREGSYRFATYTQQDGAIASAEARLRIR